MELARDLAKFEAEYKQDGSIPEAYYNDNHLIFNRMSACVVFNRDDQQEILAYKMLCAACDTDSNMITKTIFDKAHHFWMGIALQAQSFLRYNKEK